MISAFGVDHGGEVSKILGIKGTLKTGQYLRHPLAATSADVGASASVTGTKMLRRKPKHLKGAQRAVGNTLKDVPLGTGVTHTGHKLEGVLNAKKVVSSAGIDKPMKQYALEQVGGLFV